MIKLNKNSKIYIASPSNIFTGGPLALHQLAFKLKEKGFNVLMYYTNNVDLHPNFIEFNTSYVTIIEDNSNNLLIVPETSTHLLYNFKNITKSIWWLSIDNFYNVRKRDLILTIFSLKKRYNFEKNFKVYHFTQSYYAYNYLLKNKNQKNENIRMLSDYLLPIYICNEINLKRSNIILYNPKKGLKFTKKIIKCNSHYNWVPLINLSPSEVKDLLNKAKLYIDFGNHPGRDRFPREAAINGCCIITNRRGSANFEEDMPIPYKFKFDESRSKIPSISEKINSIMSNYENIIDKYSNYREFIKNNEKVFEYEINNIFILN